MPSLEAVVLLASVSLLPAQNERKGAVEIGRATAQPGETVSVPLLATYDEPLRSIIVVFRFDADRLDFVRFGVDGSEAEGTDPLALLYRSFGIGGEGLCGINPQRVTSISHRYPPGARRHLGNLFFRVRPLAAPGNGAVTPSATIDAIPGSSQLEFDDGVSHAVIPETFIAGGVTVLEPEGPRPVGELDCVQFLDRIRISFSPSEAYDSIAVSRNGSLVATLAGTAAEYVDPLGGLGTVRYSLVASRGGKESFPAECEVAVVLPSAPAVRNLLCGDPGITWTNPAPFDRISVFRNGDQIAEISGDAQAFVDPERPETLTVYTVVTELEGFRSPEVHCLDHGVWIMEAGDVQVPLGATRIVLPIYGTTSAPMEGFDVYLNTSQARFEVIRDVAAALAGTVGPADPEFFAMGIGAGQSAGPAAGVVYDYHAPKDPEKKLQVGLRQHILSFILAPTTAFSDGEVVPILFDGGGFTNLGMTQNVGRYIPGQIRFGSAGPAAVRGLRAAVAAVAAGIGGGGGGPAEARDVALSWSNGSAYETVRIERNGEVVAEIPGGSTSFVDRALAGGVYTYKVAGLDAGLLGLPASALVTTVAPPGTFLRGDSNRDRRIDIADPINTLRFLFLGSGTVPCGDAADADDDGRIGLADAMVTIRYLFYATEVLRAPGVVHPWFDPTPDGLACRG
jgi:hypothetical protein